MVSRRISRTEHGIEKALDTKNNSREKVPSRQINFPSVPEWHYQSNSIHPNLLATPCTSQGSFLLPSVIENVWSWTRPLEPRPFPSTCLAWGVGPDPTCMRKHLKADIEPLCDEAHLTTFQTPVIASLHYLLTLDSTARHQSPVFQRARKTSRAPDETRPPLAVCAEQ